MKRLITGAIVTGVLFAAATAGLIWKPVAAANDGQNALKADQALLAALGKSDPAAVSALLDEKFEWTDAEGKTLTKAQVLDDLAAFAADNQGDTDVKVLRYSELGIVYGFHHNVRFGRIWVKRSAGWRAFVFLDTPLPKQALGDALPANNTGDCDNPCRTLPYKPTTAADKAMLAEWQKTKVDEWHPDAADWATHVADEFLIINDRSERNKAGRVAYGKKLQDAGISAPGDPIERMNVSDFGDTIVMISHHVPYRGGKPYYNDRVFVHRGGHWLIAWSQQTTNQAGTPVPPVGASK